MNGVNGKWIIMKNRRYFSALPSCFIFLVVACGESVTHEPLRAELLEMERADQDLIKDFPTFVPFETLEKDPEYHEKLKQRLDAVSKEVGDRNTKRMKEIVREYGWPGKSMVGGDGAGAAWLLVQHADGDRAFQKDCLDLLKRSAEAGEASWRHVAYLTDRVLVGEGNKQRYGTQIDWSTGKACAPPDRG